VLAVPFGKPIALLMFGRRYVHLSPIIPVALAGVAASLAARSWETSHFANNGGDSVYCDRNSCLAISGILRDIRCVQYLWTGQFFIFSFCFNCTLQNLWPRTRQRQASWELTCCPRLKNGRLCIIHQARAEDADGPA
jgi:hypothetical protein